MNATECYSIICCCCLLLIRLGPAPLLKVTAAVDGCSTSKCRRPCHYTLHTTVPHANTSAPLLCMWSPEMMQTKPALPHMITPQIPPPQIPLPSSTPTARTYREKMHGKSKPPVSEINLQQPMIDGQVAKAVCVHKACWAAGLPVCVDVCVRCRLDRTCTARLAAAAPLQPAKSLASAAVRTHSFGHSSRVHYADCHSHMLQYHHLSLAKRSRRACTSSSHTGQSRYGVNVCGVQPSSVLCPCQRHKITRHLHGKTIELCVRGRRPLCK